jgi:3-hydroxymyristoyl/3-hydroxydecanoyl-(acyl carrier protein) dehydratase
MPPETTQFDYNAPIATNHPASDGHFAGNPIIPGALIMEHVRIAFEQFKSDMYLQSMVKVKNLYPLKPGKALTVKIREKTEGRFSFTCLDSDNQEIAAGDFRGAPRRVSLVQADA